MEVWIGGMEMCCGMVVWNGDMGMRWDGSMGWWYRMVIWNGDGIVVWIGGVAAMFYCAKSLIWNRGLCNFFGGCAIFFGPRLILGTAVRRSALKRHCDHGSP